MPDDDSADLAIGARQTAVAVTHPPHYQATPQLPLIGEHAAIGDGHTHHQAKTDGKVA